ncbi:MAG: hypothetical protein AAFW84_09125 [Cyanobacteria bacterium J06635_15]
MMKSPSLIALSLLAVTAGIPARAQTPADDIALDFSLPDLASDASVGSPALAKSPVEGSLEAEAVLAADTPLPIPPNAANPPISRVAVALPASVYQGNAQALSAQVEEFSAALPPAPPTLTVQPIEVAAATSPESVAVQVAQSRSPIGLSFAFEAPAVSTAIQKAEVSVPEPASVIALSTTDMAQVMEAFVFQGGRDSLVARAIGSAEGTRTPAGEYTQAFGGHVDPGNQAWNLGTFSYQHGANSPEEADHKQLARLQSQAKIIQQKAQARGLILDLALTLNALDLANQSPLAALGQGGYMDRLVEAQAQGLEGDEAILWSRTYAYFDSDQQRWNAPGLGNTLQGVNRDQQRRMNAVARAVEAAGEIPTEISQAAIASPLNPSAPPSETDANVAPNASQPLDLDDPVDQFIALDFDLPPNPAATEVAQTVTAPESTLSANHTPDQPSLEVVATPINPEIPEKATDETKPELVSAAVPEFNVFLPEYSEQN